MSFFEELKRRNVFRVGIAYAVTGWVLLQVAELVLDAISAPPWVMQVLMLIIGLGFIAAIIIAWAYEMTPEGIRRESEVDREQSVTHQTAKKLDVITLAAIAALVIFLLLDRFVLQRPAAEQVALAPVSQGTAQPAETDARERVARIPAEKSIAVLPFVAMSSGEDDGYFADGLTEEILNSLAQLPELLVTARTSSFHFKGKEIPVQEIARTLGVNHIVEGSVRKSGERLRVTAQLIRADDGFHLWSENYDSTAKDTIAVQEDIAEKIAHAMDVVMDEDKRAAMRRAGLRNVEAFIAYQKGQQLYSEAHGSSDQIVELHKANEYLAAVIEKVPDYAPAYVLHSDVFIHILTDHAVDNPNLEVSEREITTALEQAVADYRKAVEYAATAQEKTSAEIDLAYITGNWRRLPRMIERFVDGKGCSHSNWMSTIGPLFGYAGRYLDMAHENRICDPLDTVSWFDEVRTTLWAGHPEAAVSLARQGDEVAPGAWLSFQLVWALLADEQYAEAEQEIESRFRSGNLRHIFLTELAAARGEREKADELHRQYQQAAGTRGFFQVILYAWLGDRQNANRIATEIDRKPYGPNALAGTVLWCNCGAPFDLSATPNLAALLTDSGLPWPPASPIKLPLKDW